MVKPVTRTAFITGITGQDGSYLAEHLLELGYEVHGMARKVAFEAPSQRFGRILHIVDRLTLHTGSLESYPSLYHILSRNEFDEVYHLAGQSFVAEGFLDGSMTLETNITGTHNVLAALQELQPNARFYFAGTSEMFGRPEESPQNEATAFHPRSVYGISKVAGFDLTRNFREAHGMFACSGILYNHESPRRGHEFVTRKVASTVARIKRGEESELRLGDLEARRDWGHAKDYVRAMRAMLQADEPGDYVVGTGETHTVRELCELAFGEAELDYEEFVSVDERFVRPPEPFVLVSDPSKARKEIGWKPEYDFAALVREMVRAELEGVRD